MSPTPEELKGSLRKLDVSVEKLISEVSRLEGRSQLLQQELDKKVAEFKAKYPNVNLAAVTDQQIIQGMERCKKAVAASEQLLVLCANQGNLDEKDDLI